ncbi:MAG TPA: hypothetical protein HA367_06325 [Candidatus Methanofastidiosum sp.]|nr:hypothetical protein [Methanofastidiosum sp.]
MISKKIRFEVFKRDGFQCAYCGKTPPEVILEVDHIDPVSKGGSDDINNLITACFDCNRGKKNIKLDKIPAKLNENLEILKEKEEQLKEYNKLIKKIDKRFNKQVEELEDIIDEYFPEHPDYLYRFDYFFKKNTLKRFFKLLPFEEISESLNLACNKLSNDYDDRYISIKDDPGMKIFNQYRDQAIKYFCGICWKKIKNKNPLQINSSNSDNQDNESEESYLTTKKGYKCIYCGEVNLEGFAYSFQGRSFWVCNDCEPLYKKYAHNCPLCNQSLNSDGVYFYIGENRFVCSEKCMKKCIEKGYLL